jgi:hypothetical protein
MFAPPPPVASAFRLTIDGLGAIACRRTLLRRLLMMMVMMTGVPMA